MCETLKKQLIKDDYLEQFRFTQIKEKYNRMECYNNGCSEAAQLIIDKYTHMAQYICVCCGRPACWETQSYVASYCLDCWKDWVRHEHCEAIEPVCTYNVIQYSKEGKKYKTVSFIREWKKYMKNFEEKGK